MTRRRWGRIAIALAGVTAVLLAAGCGETASPFDAHVQVLKVLEGRPSVWVRIDQTVSRDELVPIARRMRDRWVDGKGQFAGGPFDREGRQKQLLVATTFVFFYLPHEILGETPWAQVSIPPGGTGEVRYLSR